MWQADTLAIGTIAWGRAASADVEVIARICDVSAQPHLSGHASIVDVRAVEAVDLVLADRLIRTLGARGPRRATTARQALVHRPGVVGACVAGALHVGSPSYPVRCFDGDAREAFRWAGVHGVFDEVEDLRASVIGTPAVVRRVQEAFDREGPVGLQRLAVLLHKSRRTLQRELRAAGTSMREERLRYLDREARRLLAGTDLDLDAIAAALRLRGASDLIRSFRATHGVTPTQWRRPHRAALAGASRLASASARR